MKAKLFTVETLTELLAGETSKGDQLRNITNESYQEYQFHNLHHLRKDMLQSLLHLARKVPRSPSRTQPSRSASTTS
jgi:hypothetical protein